VGLWLGGLGQGSVREWLQLTSQGFSMRSEWVCLPATMLAGAVPAIAMIVMLRRGAPLTALLGGLAATGVGNLSVCVTHHSYGECVCPGLARRHRRCAHGDRWQCRPASAQLAISRRANETRRDGKGLMTARKPGLAVRAH
jgi:hypothetical protein